MHSQCCPNCGHEIELKNDRWICKDCDYSYTRSSVKKLLEIIKESTVKYDGPFSEIIEYAPDYFEMFQSVAMDSYANTNLKKIVNYVISYFTLPQDVIPEDKFGAYGYIDDIFLAAYITNELKEYEKFNTFFEKHWPGTENVFDLSYEIMNIILSSPINSEENPLLQQILKFICLDDELDLQINLKIDITAKETINSVKRHMKHVISAHNSKNMDKR